MSPPWPPSSPVSSSSLPSPERARPLTEQIQVIRELWLLREQARVQAAERQFLADLQRLFTTHTHSPPPHPPSSGEMIQGSPPRAPPIPAAQSGQGANAVFESVPVDRGVAREVWGGDGGVEQARASARVTNLSPEFRALLEGGERELTRPRSMSELSGTRNVSTLLEGEFRGVLENILVRRGRRPLTRERTFVVEDQYDQYDQGYGDGRLERVVKMLQEEVQSLKNVMGASFDLQLEVQRSIRQEVSAALNEPAQLIRGSGSVGVVRGGVCTVCLERRIDSLLYACGHMCTCSLCGRQLVGGGGSCPICRAPVRDVVRAYMVNE